jgi:predicted phosphoribosyltransferase
MKWLSQWCDRVVILETPDPFLSVSRFYAEFPQVETEEALIHLQKYNHLTAQQ